MQPQQHLLNVAIDEDNIVSNTVLTVGKLDLIFSDTCKLNDTTSDLYNIDTPEYYRSNY